MVAPAPGRKASQLGVHLMLLQQLPCAMQRSGQWAASGAAQRRMRASRFCIRPLPPASRETPDSFSLLLYLSSNSDFADAPWPIILALSKPRSERDAAGRSSTAHEYPGMPGACRCSPHRGLGGSRLSARGSRDGSVGVDLGMVKRIEDFISNSIKRIMLFK